MAHILNTMKGKTKLKPLRQVVKSDKVASVKVVMLSAIRRKKKNTENSLGKKNKENCNTSAPPPKEDDDKSAIKESLMQISIYLKEYLQTKYGGGKKPKVASQFAKTFDNFLKFALLKLKEENDAKENRNWSPLPLDKTIRGLTRTKYYLVDTYLLQFDKVLKAGTILNRWTHILISVRWFHDNCSLNTKRGQMLITSFENNMKKIRKALVKEKNRDGLQKNAEKLIESGKLPERGIPELYEYVVSDYNWAVNLNARDFLNSKTYNIFISWLFSCYYICSVQGRVGGIQDMRYSQRHGLMLQNGYETSTNFKTANHHSYQAVLSSEMSSKGTEVYVREARRVVVDRANNEALNDDNAPLFLTFTGKADDQIGKRITDYFLMKSQGKLHITSTGIRSLYETTSNELYEKGTITLQQKNSVSRLGGHNGATVDQYYVKERIKKSIDGSRDFMNIVNGWNTTAPAPTTPVPTNETAVITPAPTTISQNGKVGVEADGVEMDFSADIFDGFHDEDYDGHSMSCADNEVTTSYSYSSPSSFSSSSSSSSSFSSSSSSSSFPFPSSSSSSSSSSSKISEHPIRPTNVRGCPPLPLYNCQRGQLKNAKRVLWTPEEIEYTRKVHDVLIVQLPEEEKRLICIKIWRFIHSDPAAVAIFHPAHLSKPEKLRHCIRQYINTSV